MQLICDYFLDNTSIDENEFIKDFKRGWESPYRCPLLSSENKSIVKEIFNKRNDIKNNFNLIDINAKHRLIKGSILEKKLFSKNKCLFYSNDHNKDCDQCRDEISG
ncbi:unnamed protein product [marine sediment metagenome]|uniref:Uncharacterized protein n=1 Tax=marine sediment metagenome TaxID=412755 RepID=X1HK92_9ZZZZ